jgi:hypothetical protein
MTLLQSTAQHEAAHAIFATLLGCVCGEMDIVKDIGVASNGEGKTQYVDDIFSMMPRICVDNALGYLLECNVPPWLSKMVYGSNQTRTTAAESTSDELSEKLSTLDLIDTAHNLTLELSLNKAGNPDNGPLYFDIIQSATDVSAFWSAMTTLVDVEYLPRVFVEQAPSTAHSLMQLAYLFKYLNNSAKHYHYDSNAKGHTAKNRAQAIQPISRFINMLMLQSIRDTPFTTLTASSLIYCNMLVCAAGPVAEDKKLTDRSAQSDLYITKVLGDLYGYESKDFSHFEEAALAILNNPQIYPSWFQLTEALVRHGKLRSTDAIFQNCIQPIQGLARDVASQIMLAQKPF